jgi:mRNA interferase RelE/StbE
LYTIRYTQRADRDLGRLDKDTAEKVVHAIHELRESPYIYIKKLKASNPNHPFYSFRVRRDIRVLLSIHDDVLVIHILEVERRNRSYRDY